MLNRNSGQRMIRSICIPAGLKEKTSIELFSPNEKYYVNLSLYDEGALRHVLMPPWWNFCTQVNNFHIVRFPE